MGSPRESRRPGPGRARSGENRPHLFPDRDFIRLFAEVLGLIGPFIRLIAKVMRLIGPLIRLIAEVMRLIGTFIRLEDQLVPQEGRGKAHATGFMADEIDVIGHELFPKRDEGGFMRHETRSRATESPLQQDETRLQLSVLTS